MQPRPFILSPDLEFWVSAYDVLETGEDRPPKVSRPSVVGAKLSLERPSKLVRLEK